MNHLHLETYLGKIGTGIGLEAGGTLMLGWKKLEEAAEGAFAVDCMEMDWILWEEFDCCKAFSCGEEVVV